MAETAHRYWREDHYSRLLNEEESTAFDDSQVLRDTFMVYGSTLAAIVLLFCWARRRFPNVYNLKNWVPNLTSSIAADQYGFFSWIWHVYMVTEDELLEHCGMDAVCFVRIVQMGYKLSVIGMLNAVWLMPLYATAEESEGTSNVVDGVVKITISHVPSGSLRLIGTVLAAWVLFGYAMYLISNELEWFIEMRHKFLRKPLARNYGVFVRNIPEQFQSNAALEAFFQSCFGDDNILEAYVIVQAGNLAKLETQREAIVAKLEQAIAQCEKTGLRPMHGDSMLMGEKVDSIDTYKMEIKDLNKDIAERINKLETQLGGKSAFPNDIDGQSHDGIAVVSQLTSTSQDEALYTLHTEDKGLSYPSHDAELGSEPDRALVSDVNENNHSAVSKGFRSMTSKFKESAGAAVDGMQNATASMGNVATSAAALVTGGEDGELLPSGFVVFKRLSTTNAALQMIHHGQPFSMEVTEAPDPEDVYWGNVGRTHKDLQLGLLLSFAMTAGLCVLWTIPMAFIASLSTVDALRDIQFIDDLLDAAPFLVPVLEILAPLFVVIANSLLPMILEFITLFEGPISNAVIEASLFVKLSTFMIIQTFFVSALSGGLLQEISNIIKNPTSIVNLLAMSLPAQSTYFNQIVFVATVMGTAMELLRVVPVVLAGLRSFIGPRLTEKQRNTTFLGLRPFCDPKEFEHADFASASVLNFVVLLVYSVIAPITAFIIGFCFFVRGAMFRHQFIYIYPTTSDSGGKIWMSFIRILLTCLLIAELTIAGLLALKKASIASSLFVPLVVVTILFSIYIRQKHFQIAEHLPTKDALQEDLGRGQNFDFSFVHSAYKQPELAAEKKVVVSGFSAIQEESDSEEALDETVRHLTDVSISEVETADSKVKESEESRLNVISHMF